MQAPVLSLGNNSMKKLEKLGTGWIYAGIYDSINKSLNGINKSTYLFGNSEMYVNNSRVLHY